MLKFVRWRDDPSLWLWTERLDGRTKTCRGSRFLYTLRSGVSVAQQRLFSHNVVLSRSILSFSIEIFPCLDPGYCVQKTVRSRFSLGTEKDAGLTKYMSKALPLPINTFAGIINWCNAVHAAFRAGTRPICLIGHTHEQKESSLRLKLLLGPKDFPAVSLFSLTAGKRCNLWSIFNL